MARTSGSDGRRTGEAIRRAAIDLIAERGFEAVTLRDLADAVGIQAGSLYRYFPSKNALLLTIMEEHLEDLTGREAEGSRWRGRADRMAAGPGRRSAGRRSTSSPNAASRR